MTDQMLTQKAWALIEQGNALVSEAGELLEEDALPKFEQAEDCYRQALALDPTMHELFNNWGTLLSAKAKVPEDDAEALAIYQQAFDRYAQALALNPQKASILNNWANALCEMADLLSGADQAAAFQACFDKLAAALAIDPNRALAYSSWANALAEQAYVTEDETAALSLLRQGLEKWAHAVRLRPNWGWGLRRWGMAYGNIAAYLEGEEQQQALREACQRYSQSLQAEPDQHDVYVIWAETLMELANLLDGDACEAAFNEAGEYYARACQIEPDTGNIAFAWAAGLAQLSERFPAPQQADILRRSIASFTQALDIVGPAWWLMLQRSLAESRLAALLSGEERIAAYQVACDTCAQAAERPQENGGARIIWARNLDEMADWLEGEAKKATMLQACDLALDVTERYPDYVPAWSTYGVCAYNLARAFPGPESLPLLRMALQKAKKAKDLGEDWDALPLLIHDCLLELARLEIGAAQIAAFWDCCLCEAEALDEDPESEELLDRWTALLDGYHDLIPGAERTGAVFHAYRTLLKGKEDDPERLAHWGNVLVDLAVCFGDAHRRVVIDEAMELVRRLLTLAPDWRGEITGWGWPLAREIDDLTGEERAQRRQEAIEIYQRMEALSDAPNYHLACLYALDGDKDQALSRLEAFAHAPFTLDREGIEDDPDLESLRGEPRYQALMATTADA